MLNRFILLVIIAVSTSFSSFSQLYDSTVKCSKDTFIVKQLNENDSVIAFSALECTKRSNMSIKLILGLNHFDYSSKTSDWIPSHFTPNFTLELGYRGFNVGNSFKPMTVNPNAELSFDGNVLPTYAKLNVIKTETYLNYQIDFKYGITLEPFLGFVRTSFGVINQDEIGRTYSFQKTRGANFGCFMQKYFKFQDYEYFSIFGSLSYGTSDYSKVHPSLGSGYSEYSIGLAYKWFPKAIFYDPID